MSNSKEIDTQIDQIVSKIESFKLEIESLRSKISPKWKTAGFLDIVGCNVKKIQVADKKDVISAIAHLMRLKVSYDDTFNFLGIKPVDSLQVIANYTIDDYLSDLKKRYQMLDLKEKEEHLVKMQNIAESFESTDRKRNKALADIMNDLNNFSTQ